jgi:putative flavoprotein involved in K+ transport
LSRLGRPCVVLEGGARIGDAWRNRYDSLRLFTPARYDGLPGLRFPAPAWSFPGRDAMAEYLESYAAHFALPVRTGIRVDGLARSDDGFVVSAGDLRVYAYNVVLAIGAEQRPWLPPFGTELDERIVQLHSADYRNPAQLGEGNVLVVGAGNSGADLALEAARSGRRTWLSGRHPGQLPFRIETRRARLPVPLIFWAFRNVLSVRTPVGRKMRPKVLAHSGPLIRVKSADIEAAGIERVHRVAGVRDGLPLLEDGRVLDVGTVLWCTGFEPRVDWIEFPLYGEDGQPEHRRGVAVGQPGLYFVGAEFQQSLASAMIQGVGPDAAYVVRQIARHRPVQDRAPSTDVPAG